MPLDPEDEVRSAAPHVDTEDFALRLLELAGNHSVRVVEALAAARINGGIDAVSTLGCGGDVLPTQGLSEDTATIDDFGRRLGLCRRVARRALRGSLADPTRGANAFHRIDEGPDWARDLLPVATFGPFLFYRR